ncbi:uncharacterized protein [Linepithema humile]|uniref:uncharacterized protein n=1 Tax=Linepithema humile TaxID=83485 RepID=UPI000623566E|nr:PREDICTED: uncharacterized protein LOC105667491 [Linepithema humile]
MQEEPKNISRLARIRRGQNSDVPEVVRKDLSSSVLLDMATNATTSRNRTTMMPNEIRQTQKPLKKKITVNRHSIMPSHVSLDAQKKMDTASRKLELLYDEYLQAMLTDLIIKKKTEEREHLMVRQLSTVDQEVDQDTNKLIKIKTREHDIVNLKLVQKEIDEQLVAVEKCTKNGTFKMVKNMLSKLESLLEPLDVLRCNDIVLPKTQDEWKDIQILLVKCSNILKDITSLIGSKDKTYCTINTELKNFTETYNEIENLQKKLEATLCNLQVLILKNSSFLLAHNEINKEED